MLLKRKSVLVDITLCIIIVLVLLIVLPIISSILKNLIALEFIIVIAGAIGLRFLVQKIRNKVK
jgi:hypothetical protein